MRTSKLFVGLAALATVDAACTDTVDWQFMHDGRAYDCSHFDNPDVCSNGSCVETPIGSLCGEFFNFPELNCCVCGKGAALVGALETAVSNAEANAAQVIDATTAKADEIVKEAEDAKSRVEAAANEASDTASTVAQDAKSGAEKLRDKLFDEALTDAQLPVELDPTADETLNMATTEESNAEVAMVPATKKTPSFLFIFAILLLVGSCVMLLAAWYYGFSPNCWPCRKRVPCDDGYERIPTTALFKENAMSPDFTSWSYGATSGRMTSGHMAA